MQAPSRLRAPKVASTVRVEEELARLHGTASAPPEYRPRLLAAIRAAVSHRAPVADDAAHSCRIVGWLIKAAHVGDGYKPSDAVLATCACARCDARRRAMLDHWEEFYAAEDARDRAERKRRDAKARRERKRSSNAAADRFDERCFELQAQLDHMELTARERREIRARLTRAKQDLAAARPDDPSPRPPNPHALRKTLAYRPGSKEHRRQAAVSAAMAALREETA